MNPLDVKIWIFGLCAFHTSRFPARAVMVPNRPFPWPVNRRSRAPFGEGDDGCEVEAEAPVALLGAGGADVFADVLVGVPVEDGCALLVTGAAAVCEPVEPVELLLPQPTVAEAATREPRITAIRRQSLRRGELDGQPATASAYWIHRLVASTRPGRTSSLSRGGSAIRIPTTVPAISAAPGTGAGAST